MGEKNNLIENVADTAFWVAAYRAKETERQDRLFSDPLAAKLAGTRGKGIIESLPGAREQSWVLVLRTRVIDEMIEELVRERAIDTVLNLGAGLDTRPYRLALDPKLKWIEVDFANTLQYKAKILEAERPTVELSRYALDLAQRPARRELFAQIGAASRSTLVITEGLIPYLTEQAVSELSDDLNAVPQLRFWLQDFIAPDLVEIINDVWKEQLERSPFLFTPPNWVKFFEDRKWIVRQERFAIAEARRLGRESEIAGFDGRTLDEKMTGYLLFEKDVS